MSDDLFQFSEEDRDLYRDSLRRALADGWPVLKALDLSQDEAAARSIWKQLGELSIPELGRDPAMGGLREILIVFEELGRACCPVPLLGAIVQNLIALHLERVGIDTVDGGKFVAVGLGTYDGDVAASGVTQSGDAITGTVNFVENASQADRYMIFLEEPSAIAIVEAGNSSVVVRDTPSLSLPPLASVSFTNAPALILPIPAQLLKNLAQIVRLCVMARALGSAHRGFDIVVEYANTRKQFGQFIGQFQAVQHRLADNLTRLDGARLTLDAAATAYDESLTSWSVFADLALAHAGPRLRQLAIDMHQLMGAIGYSEEHELPRHFRQIHGNTVRFGGALRARAAIGSYLVGAAPAL